MAMGELRISGLLSTRPAGCLWVPPRGLLDFVTIGAVTAPCTTAEASLLQIPAGQHHQSSAWIYIAAVTTLYGCIMEPHGALATGMMFESHIPYLIHPTVAGRVEREQLRNNPGVQGIKGNYFAIAGLTCSRRSSVTRSSSVVDSSMICS
jgi:hypothetical protein